MINVLANIAPDASDLAGLACEHLDDLATYATHLTGSADDALDFVAGGLAHAAKYPPTRLRQDGRAALYRAMYGDPDHHNRRIFARLTESEVAQ